MARESRIIKDDLDGSVALTNGDGVSLEAEFCDGDFSGDGLMADQQAPRVYRPRGKKLNQVLRAGEHSDPTFTFSCMFTDVSDDDLDTLLNFATFTGKYDTSASTSASQGNLKTLHCVFKVEGNGLGDAGDHQMEYQHSHLQVSVAEGQPNRWNISGTCYGDVNLT